MKFCSLANTQEFSLAYSLLHDSLTCFLSKVLISCFSLFNLQGTLRCARNSFILSQSSPFVKNFFRRFSISFSHPNSPFDRDSLIILTHQSRFVKNFFHIPMCFSCFRPLSEAPRLSAQILYYTRHHLSSTFFKKLRFFKFYHLLWPVFQLHHNRWWFAGFISQV